MKKIIIGRNNNCHVVIPDTSDLVSRKQAVLTVTFWGKMVIYDTSNNGTYVNGSRLENGKGVRVTRKDKVSFARVADLDWKDVRDPYRTLKLILVIGAVVAIVLGAALGWWFSSSQKGGEPVKTEEVRIRGEATTTVKPEALPVDNTDKKPVQQPQKTKKQKKSKKGSAVEKKEEKDVTKNTPIVY